MEARVTNILGSGLKGGDYYERVRTASTSPDTSYSATTSTRSASMSTELYGFEANVTLTKEQIQRLLRCGIEPSHVSYEAYKYALALLSESGFKKERRLRIASIIRSEERRVGKECRSRWS